MKANHFIFYGWVAIVTAFSVGCNSGNNSAGTESSDAGDGSSLTIAVVPKSTGGEFWETVEQGARDAAAELDVDTVDRRIRFLRPRSQLSN